MENFKELNLPEALNHTLEHMEFTTPTPIQAQAIPAALEGRDILGSAQTGTGKTGAFGIPLVTKLMTSSRGTALVMTPTRELATQVAAQLQAMLGKRSSIKMAVLIGGESMPKQLQQLRNRPRLLVGTPGRINDHLERGSLMLHDTNFLVLDETDRMLDMGFTIQIEKIIKFMPKTRQTLLFSATLPKNIVGIANSYMQNPVRVSVDAPSSAATNITHDVINVTDGEKYSRFVQELDEREGSIIVFVKTKHGTQRLADKLCKQGHSADAIHGDLRQSKRDRVIANFREKKHRILVATDVAARGLDIPHIEHVINYDLPQCAEDYIHRIGRTARAGAEGAAVCLVAPIDRSKWRAIERLMNPNAKPEEDSFEHKPKGNPNSPAARRQRRRNQRSGEQGGGDKPSGGRKPRRSSKPSEGGKSSDKPRSGKPDGSGKPSGGAGKPRRSAKPSTTGKPSGAGRPRRSSKPAGGARSKAA